MPNSVNDLNSVEKRLPRWQFRKSKKIEKRRSKRQKLAKQRLSPEPQHKETENLVSLEEQEKYKANKQRWEEREKQFQLIELTKKRAQEKANEAKKLSQKRWKDTLLNLPIIPPSFSIKQDNDTIKKPLTTPLKTFVQSSNTTAITAARKTYRERYLEKKRASKIKN